MKKSKILIFIGLFQLIGFTAFANHPEDIYPDGDQRGRYHPAVKYNKGKNQSFGFSFSDSGLMDKGEVDLLKYDSEFSHPIMFQTNSSFAKKIGEFIMG